MNEVKFLAFADLHHEPGYYNCAPERLAKIRQRAEDNKVDFVLHCGDLTHGPKLVPEIVEQCDEFPMPMLHCIGNHECDKSSYEEVLEAYHMDNGYYYKDISGFRFICYDANRMEMDGQVIHYDMKNYWHPPVGIRREDTIMVTLGKEQLAWIEKTIMDSPYPCVLFGHHSFERQHDDFTKEELQAIREMFQRVNKDKQRVQLVICGHYHVDNLRLRDNVPFFELNSASNYYFNPGHNLFPEEVMRDHGAAAHTLIWTEPLSAVITLRDDGYINIEGSTADYWCGVSLKSLGLRIDDSDAREVTPEVMTTAFKLDMRGTDNL